MKWYFYIIILIFIKKDIKMIIVWLMQGSWPNKDVVLSLYNMTCGLGELCSTTMFELNDIFDTHFSFDIFAPRYNMKVAVGHIVILIKFGLIVQP